MEGIDGEITIVDREEWNHSKYRVSTLIQVANQRVNKLLLNIHLHIYFQLYRCMYASRIQGNSE
jgi:hypothetical protein